MIAVRWWEMRVLLRFVGALVAKQTESPRDPWHPNRREPYASMNRLGVYLRLIIP